MNLEQYFKFCSFKEQKQIINDNFFFEQKEIVFKEFKNNNEHVFESIEVRYDCFFRQSLNIIHNAPFILIPSKNNLNLIKYTINNLITNQIDKICNIIVIDDRSTEDYSCLLENNVSYLRVDNKKGFNFSMLCNIGAYVANYFQTKQIILWNNDLWIEDKNVLIQIIENHKKDNSTISGTKLLYSLKSFNGQEEDNINIKNHYPEMKNGKWRGTVQFGGSVWLPVENHGIRFTPFHFKRFSKPDNHLVNSDKGEIFITGAFQLIDLEWFINSGGLNPSLSTSYQDVDLCLKAISDNKKVMYYGKNRHLYHDESLTFTTDNVTFDRQRLSDHVLFAKIWNNEIVNLIK